MQVSRREGQKGAPKALFFGDVPGASSRSGSTCMQAEALRQQSNDNTVLALHAALLDAQRANEATLHVISVRFGPISIESVGDHHFSQLTMGIN